MTNKDAADILKAFVEGYRISEHADLMRLYPRDIEVFEKAIEALEKVDKDDWIYAPVNDPEWNRMFEEVEKALGFKLFIWQKSYILGQGFRQYGETTAKALQELLFGVDEEPIDYSKPATNKRWIFYKDELRKIKEKLDNAGIKTRPVFFSIDDELAWKHEKTMKKNYETPVANLVCDTVDDLVKQCSDAYGTFLLECFEPFGITKDNIVAWIGRIQKEEYNDTNTDTIYHRYFIDGSYAFTISVRRSINDGHVFTQEHRRLIEEDLKEGGNNNVDI